MNQKEIRELTESIPLDLKEIQETAGNTPLTLTTLRDLDATIDRIFEALSQLQKPELLDSLCPYFGVIWPSARALAECVDHTLIAGLQKTLDTKILELGCGLAMPSLVSAKKGAQTWATDFHPQVERFLVMNREKNQAGLLRYVDWDWRSLPELPSELRPLWGKADWVIASDVLYDADLPIPLAKAMAQAAAPRGKITITDPGRPYLQLFCDELTKNQGYRMSTRVVRVKNAQEVFVLDFER
ncbi:MAG: hypothetical protein KGQ59_00530 [Bdellovibrionales bacterium]|nr:hypothetical protein [Bdellovibrionales bacterium]